MTTLNLEDKKLYDVWVRKLTHVIGEDYIQFWMNTHNTALNNRTPWEMIKSGDTFYIERMINELSHEAIF